MRETAFRQQYQSGYYLFCDFWFLLILLLTDGNDGSFYDPSPIRFEQTTLINIIK